jgi:hypothetical protein
MAIPNRRDQNPPTHVGDIGDERVVENVSRGGWRWWFIWPVVIALVLWWAGWGWGGSGGWWWGARSHNTAIPAPAGARTTETLANAGADQPLTNAGAAAGSAGHTLNATGPGVPVLTAADKRGFIGRSFDANGVPVLQKLNDRAMWIGGTQPTLAVVTNNGAANNVGPGKNVDAKGTVKKAPPQAQAMSEWGLNKQGASRLENEGAYIEISQLTVPQQ